MLRGDLAALLVSTFAYFAVVGLGMPALPRYVLGPIGGSALDVGLAIGALSVAAVAVRPLLPALARRLAPRVLLVAGALIAGVTTLALGAVDTVGAVVALRAAGGVGEALFFVTASAAVYGLVPAASAGAAQSVFSVAVYGGLLTGPALAEVLRAHAGFSAVWWAGLAFGLAAALAGARVRPRSVPAAASRPGGSALAPALLPGMALACVTWGVIAFTAFVALSAADEGRTSVAPELALFGATVIGVRVMGAGWLAARPQRAVAMAALVAAAAGLACLAALPGTGRFALAAVLLGLGEALAYPALIALAVTGVPADRRTAVIATFTAFLDGALLTAGVALAAVLDAAGFRTLYAAAATVTLAGLLPLAAVRAAGRSAPAPAPGP